MRSAALIFAALAVAAPAAASEAVTTADRSAAAPAAADVAALPPGDEAPPPDAEGAADDASRGAHARCEAPPDRKPHGEVWAGVGTGGYRAIGGVVSQPIGKCGQLTIGGSYSRGAGYWRR
jgi:hypothetical protein